MSNLPPGVTESMIPGNRPEDEAFERLLDGEIGDFLFSHATMLIQLDKEDILKPLKALVDAFEVCHWCGQVVEDKSIKFGGQTFCSQRCRDNEEVVARG